MPTWWASFNAYDKLRTIPLIQHVFQVPHLTNSTSDLEIAQQAKIIDAHMRQEIIGKRNVNMADRVFALLNEYPTKSFFFAFGAGTS